MHLDRKDYLLQLPGELENFEEIVKHLLPQPGAVPRIHGIDIHGGTLALNGPKGGDHLIFVDFKERFDLERRIRRGLEQGKLDVVENLRRCQKTAGIAVLDVSGHRVTDAFMAAMLHQAFLVGAIYELDMFGHVTKRLFENLNTRFYQSSSDHKFVSLIYGEISEYGGFRFLSAAQPFPLVFSSRHDRFMEVSEDLRISSPPLGMVPSRHVTDGHRTASPLGFKEDYKMNEWVLMGAGDILLLHTDGLAEHRNTDDDYYPLLHTDGPAGGRNTDEEYYPHRLEQKLRAVKHQTAAEIFDAIRMDLLAFGKPADDITLVVIKRI
jgi:serine phosphatase RsbU (regulator of sigma subunit)